MSCTTCQPMPTPCYAETLDRYSLQDDLYLFVIECLPGHNCGGGFIPGSNSWSFYHSTRWEGYVTLICCDDQQDNVLITSGMTQPEIDHIIGMAIEACLRRTAFCSPPCDGPACVPPAPPPPPPPDTEDPPTIYVSPPWKVQSTCPNGSIFTYTVPAGRFLGFNEQAVLLATQREANRLARTLRFCLGDLTGECCADVAFDETILATGTSPAHSWSIVGGALPPGLNWQHGWVAGNRVHIIGTPTTGGTYSFTLRATNSSGNYSERTYTICVVQISPVAAALPDAPVNTPYSQTLTVNDCAALPLRWIIAAGALPAGISLDQNTGVLSGTPTVAGNYAFTVSLETESD